MSRQFNNMKSHLEKYDYNIVCTIDEFKINKNIVFRCVDNHVNTFTINSFKNKLHRLERINEMEKLCTKCVYAKQDVDLFKIESSKILQRNGHILRSIHSLQNVEYECGNCKHISKCWLSNLHRDTGWCPNCQRDQFKNTEENVISRLGEFDVELIKYNSCKNIQVVCRCGNIFNTSLYNVERGRLCLKCKISRSSATNIERYGAENPFQSSMCKEKMKTTCMKNYGVSHHLHNPEIFKKHRDSSNSGCGVKKYYKFPSGRIDIVLGYEPQCIDELLKTYNEKNIVTDPTIIPTINYFRIDPDGSEKQALYYTDIMLPDRLIEVKSKYTYEQNQVNNERKFNGCVAAGYDIEVWIYNNKKTIGEKRIYTKNGIRIIL